MKLYFVHIESPEYEGMFKEDGTNHAYWSSNDADWRGEYFDHWLKEAGVEILYPKGKLQKQLQKALLKLAEGD